ncbi:MAG: hypothetical protein AB7G62_06700 [Magnetospirillum sp.]
MQIGSMGSAATYQPVTQARPQEVTERGPDRDNDGDEKAAASVQAASSPPPGRGRNLNILA